MGRGMISKLGLFVILVEIAGFIFYTIYRIYLGSCWCLFWIIGIYWYEKIHYKRNLQLLCMLYNMERRAVVYENDRRSSGNIREKNNT